MYLLHLTKKTILILLIMHVISVKIFCIGTPVIFDIQLTKNKSQSSDSKNFDLKINQTNQFIFTKNLTLNDTFPQITEIRSLDSNTILLRGKTEDGQEKVKLLSGTQYEKKENELKIPLESQQVKFVKDKILINTGNLIEEKSATESVQFILNKYYLSEAMLVTEEYILVNVRFKYCDTLVKVGLKNFNVSTQELKDCFFNQQYYYFKDLMNGQIVYGGDRAFYIIDKQTLQIKQTIRSPSGWLESISLFSVDSFHDQENNSTILSFYTLNYQSSYKTYIYKYNPEILKYQYVTQIYTKNYPFKLTGINEAISFDNDKVYHWKNLIFLKGVSFDIYNDFYLENRQYVLVSNQQNFFVVLFKDFSIQENPFFLQIFSINDSYKIQSLFKVPTCQNHLTFLTSDDKLLFTMNRELSKEKNLRIIDIQTQNQTKIIPQPIQIFLTFHLFDVAVDRFIILLRKTQDFFTYSVKLLILGSNQKNLRTNSNNPINSVD